jgi:hypothetical protein
MCKVMGQQQNAPYPFSPLPRPPWRLHQLPVKLIKHPPPNTISLSIVRCRGYRVEVDGFEKVLGRLSMDLIKVLNGLATCYAYGGRGGGSGQFNAPYCNSGPMFVAKNTSIPESVNKVAKAKRNVLLDFK